MFSLNHKRIFYFLQFKLSLQSKQQVQNPQCLLNYDHLYWLIRIGHTYHQQSLIQNEHKLFLFLELLQNLYHDFLILQQLNINSDQEYILIALLMINHLYINFDIHNVTTISLSLLYYHQLLLQNLVKGVKLLQHEISLFFKMHD